MFPNTKWNEAPEPYSSRCSDSGKLYKVFLMAKIIYFGTNGSSGHTAIGIDADLTHDEYNMWCECDNDNSKFKTQNSKFA